MLTCENCAFETRSRSSLASHRRRMHTGSDDSVGGSNVQAVKVTLGELRRLGRIEKIDAAKVQALLSIASALDSNPFNSQMWREYREAIGGLVADDRSAGSSAIDDLLDELSSPVRDKA